MNRLQAGIDFSQKKADSGNPAWFPTELRRPPGLGQTLPEPDPPPAVSPWSRSH